MRTSVKVNYLLSQTWEVIVDKAIPQFFILKHKVTRDVKSLEGELGAKNMGVINYSIQVT